MVEDCSSYFFDIQPSGIPPNVGSATCFTRISEASGTINTPYHPKTYPENLDCVYQFVRYRLEIFFNAESRKRCGPPTKIRGKDKSARDWVNSVLDALLHKKVKLTPVRQSQTDVTQSRRKSERKQEQNHVNNSCMCEEHQYKNLFLQFNRKK